MPLKTELENKVKQDRPDPDIVQVLNQIAKIRLKASMISDGQLRVEIKNYCDSQSIAYLSRIKHSQMGVNPLTSSDKMTLIRKNSHIN